MPDSQLNEIGQRIRRLRAIRNMPQRRLSEMTGLSPSFISQLERGQSGASLPSLVRIASVLGVSARHLLADEGPQVQVGRRADRTRSPGEATRSPCSKAAIDQVAALVTESGWAEHLERSMDR